MSNHWAMDDEPDEYTPLTSAGRDAMKLMEIPDEAGAYEVLNACVRYIGALEKKPHPLDVVVAVGTRLHRVDAALRPYELSAAVQRSLSASSDHLHTLMVLFTKGEAQHTYSPFTIVRGSLEALVQGLYGLGSRSTHTMVQRSLHLEYSNVKNAHSFSRKFGTLDPDDKRLGRLEARATTAGVKPSSLKEALRYSHIIETVDDEHATDGLMMAIWQLTSGIAHNKSWATVALTDRQEIEGTRDEIGASFHLTSNSTWLATCVRTACVLHEMLRITYVRQSIGKMYRRDVLQAEALYEIMATSNPRGATSTDD